jgi:hypothetical protein
VHGHRNAWPFPADLAPRGQQEVNSLIGESGQAVQPRGRQPGNEGSQSRPHKRHPDDLRVRQRAGLRDQDSPAWLLPAATVQAPAECRPGKMPKSRGSAHDAALPAQ